MGTRPFTYSSVNRKYYRIEIEEDLNYVKELAITREANIDKYLIAIEELLGEQDVLLQQMDQNEEKLTDPDIVVTAADVEVSEECRRQIEYKLGMPASYILKFSNESTYNAVSAEPRRYLQVSNEGLGDILEKIWKKIKAFFNAILEIFGLGKGSVKTKAGKAEKKNKETKKEIEELPQEKKNEKIPVIPTEENNKKTGKKKNNKKLGDEVTKLAEDTSAKLDSVTAILNKVKTKIETSPLYLYLLDEAIKTNNLGIITSITDVTHSSIVVNEIKKGLDEITKLQDSNMSFEEINNHMQAFFDKLDNFSGGAGPHVKKALLNIKEFIDFNGDDVDLSKGEIAYISNDSIGVIFFKEHDEGVMSASIKRYTVDITKIQKRITKSLSKTSPEQLNKVLDILIKTSENKVEATIKNIDDTLNKVNKDLETYAKKSLNAKKKLLKLEALPEDKIENNDKHKKSIAESSKIIAKYFYNLVGFMATMCTKALSSAVNINAALTDHIKNLVDYAKED